MVKQDMEDVYTVGMGYMTGQGRPLDQKKGIEYLRQAADAGFLPAVRDLGVAYLNGQGVPPDAEKAYGYLKKASDQLGPNAMYHLALMYENGAYVEKDIYEALRLMGYAAGMGFSAAAVEADRIEDKIDAMRKAKLDSRPILNLEISDADVEACCCIKMYNAVIAKEIWVDDTYKGPQLMTEDKDGSETILDKCPFCGKPVFRVPRNKEY